MKQARSSLPRSFLPYHIYKEHSIYPGIIYSMTNKPKSRRSKNAVNSRNDALALADSSSGLNTQAVTPAEVSIPAEGVCRLNFSAQGHVEFT